MRRKGTKEDWPLPVAAIVRIDSGLGKRVYHVRANVDDHVVLRYWSPRRGWCYTVEGQFWWMYSGISRGTLDLSKVSK